MMKEIAVPTVQMDAMNGKPLLTPTASATLPLRGPYNMLSV
jgi:hypothetical protein